MTPVTPLSRPLPGPRSAKATAGSNYSVKDDIQAYWDRRSETFDLSAGHKIRTDAEFEAWLALLRDHAPALANCDVLELASGTGEVTRVLLALGCRVEGLDLSPAMVKRAQTKHPQLAPRIHLGDAENTMMPDEAFDAVVTRHLVWTLLNPGQAFADWYRVLRPGGTLVIVDGNWHERSWSSRLLATLATWFDKPGMGRPVIDTEAHRAIKGELPFRDGLRPDHLAALLTQAGFDAISTQPVRGVLWPQLRGAAWHERWTLLSEGMRQFIVTARKPGTTSQK